jgi:hypothetical protein
LGGEAIEMQGEENSPIESEDKASTVSKGDDGRRSSNKSPATKKATHPARESRRLREKERKNYCDSDDLDDILDLNKEDLDALNDEGLFSQILSSKLFSLSILTLYIAAAINADLSPYDLGSLEKKELPQFVEYPGAYLQVRNHILKLWHNNVNNYLTIQEAEKAIQVTLCSSSSSFPICFVLLTKEISLLQCRINTNALSNQHSLSLSALDLSILESLSIQTRI